MDETQKRKISAKEFIEKNRTLGLGVIAIFVIIFAIYLIIIFIYGRTNQETSTENINTEESSTGFFENLLPIFSENSQNPNLDENFLGNFNRNNFPNTNEDEVTEASDKSKVVRIEERPVVGYTTFQKPVSIKNFIKKKPKICSDKIEVVTQRDSKSPAVAVLQNTLKSVEGFEGLEMTGILDSETRDSLYNFQKEYADILYKQKVDKTPTRVIDKETAHFLNLLCNLENEEPGDFVLIPTLRYIVKETREIYDYNTDSKQKTLIEAKVGTGTQAVTFSKKGDLVVYRKENNGTIESIFYNIKNKSITRLENEISTLDFNDKDILYYGVPSSTGINIKSYDYLTNSTKKVATLPLNEWNLFVISNNELGIYSKPTALADGIFMALSLQNGKLRQLAGPLSGMSVQKTSSPDFSIFSVGGQGSSKILLLNNNTRKIGDFGINTFAEKCSQNIFADGIFCAVPQSLDGSSVYPDDWYKGKTHTNDLLVFKTLSGTTTKVVSYLENKNFSVTDMLVNSAGIFFIDEKTSNLYSLEL